MTLQAFRFQISDFCMFFKPSGLCLAYRWGIYQVDGEMRCKRVLDDKSLFYFPAIYVDNLGEQKKSHPVRDG